MGRSLLIVACSQRKRPDPELLPAIERYDGGSFRVLRKAKREGYLTDSVDILILSAKYGLINALDPIDNYDQQMDSKRASELNKEVISGINHLLNINFYEEIYVDLGKDYLAAIDGLSIDEEAVKVQFAVGRIGERLRALKQWLRKGQLG